MVISFVWVVGMAGEPGAEDAGGGVGSDPRDLRGSHLQPSRYSPPILRNGAVSVFSIDNFRRSEVRLQVFGWHSHYAECALPTMKRQNE